MCTNPYHSQVWSSRKYLSPTPKEISLSKFQWGGQKVSKGVSKGHSHWKKNLLWGTLTCVHDHDVTHPNIAKWTLVANIQSQPTCTVVKTVSFPFVQFSKTHFLVFKMMEFSYIIYNLQSLLVSSGILSYGRETRGLSRMPNTTYLHVANLTSPSSKT